jgi:hypothetical protein
MLDNQRRLHELTGDAAWLGEAAETLKPVAALINRSPRGSGQAIAALYHLRIADPQRFNAAIPKAETGPVQVRVESSAVPLDANGLGEMAVVIEMKSPWHVALPGTEDVMPVRIASATPGIEVTPQWPKGKTFSDQLGSMQVLEGTSRVLVSVQRSDAAASSLELSVSWQACDDKVCLRPETRTFTVEVAEASN